MTRIAPVNLAFNPKTLWFDARNLELGPRDFVVVLTARGLELGHMAGTVFEATEEQLGKLKSPLKPVKRVATEEDIAQGEQMEAKGKEALGVFKQMVEESGVDMRPISVEYLLEGDKAVFYFEAEDRVDFRDLVRSLAAHFHVRVDMRQIGVRDEARMVGGYGHCGQQLCCARMGGEFCPVSIRMAKEQDLSLNPQKISGVCGRLMCCLRYEYDAYKDFKSRAPKQNAMVTTPAGPAKVVGLDVPREEVMLRTEEDHKNVRVPLSGMEPAEEGQRPKVVEEQAWAEATAPKESEALAASYLTNQLTGTDKLGNARAVRRNKANVKNATGSTPIAGASSAEPRRRRRTRDAAAEAERTPAADTHRQRRRRSTKLGADGSQVTEKVAAEETQKAAKPASAAKQEAGEGRRRRRRGGQQRKPEGQAQAQTQAEKPQRKSDDNQAKKGGSPRPGHKSSGLRKPAEAGKATETPADKPAGQRRRRRRRGGGSNAEKGGSNES